MRLHRFFIEQPLSESKHFTLTDEELIRQLIKVFRYKTGQEVILFDNSGFEFHAEIHAMERNELVFHIKDMKKGLVPAKKVSLCFSLVKKDNVETIVQKGTELGVTDFYPLLSERSEKKDFNRERVNRIVLEAAEQSGWAVLPVIHEVQNLKDILHVTNNMKQIVFDTTISKSAAKKSETSGVALFIGPEGGWSEAELMLFKEKGVDFDTLGPSVLRAETAALVAAARYTI